MSSIMKGINENSVMKGLVDETEAKKGIDGKRCWKGKRYAGTENGKDKCIPVKEESDEEALERLKKNKSREKWMADADLEHMHKRHAKNKPVKNESAYEKDLADNEPRTVIGVYGAKSKEFRKKFRNQAAQDRFFDHPDREGNYEIHYVQKMNENSERIIVRQPGKTTIVNKSMQPTPMARAAMGALAQHYQSELDDLNKKREARRRGDVDEGVFDLLKKKPSPRDNMRERLRSMSTDELRQELKDYKARLSGARASGSLVGAAVSDHVNAIQSELDKRAFDDFTTKNPDWDKDMNEGVIVGHDASDPEIAILGGAGTMSLSRLKKKAHQEALQLADDIANGKYSASSYNMRQLHNTLNTIVAAEEEMKKKYFGEDYTGEFAIEKTSATNPYGGQKDRQFRSAIGEGINSHNERLGFDVRTDFVWLRTMNEATEKGTEFQQWLTSYQKKTPSLEKNKPCILAMVGMMGDTIKILYGDAIYKGEDETDYILSNKTGTHRYSKLFQLVFNNENSFNKFLTMLRLLYSELKVDVEKSTVYETRNVSLRTIKEIPDTSGPVGTQQGGWHRTDMEEDTAYAGGMGQGGNAGQSYRKFKPKSAGTFKEEQLARMYFSA